MAGTVLTRMGVVEGRVESGRLRTIGLAARSLPAIP